MPKSKRSKTSPFKGSLWLGMDFFAWIRLLIRNRFAVRPGKLPEIALITIVSAFNSCLRWLVSIFYGRAAREIDLPDDPVFVIGHWRTGTTMLHELLALDPRNRCPSTYECLSPNHFLLSESFVRRFAWWILPRTRPFDNMRMSFDRPQEDEAALCLRGQPSPFLSVAFPGRPPQDDRYATLDNLSASELALWKSRLSRFLRLLLLKRPGQLVLKSPQHTFRLPALIAMFPRAKFVHIVRDPYTVFPSTVHFWKTMYETYGLQRFDEDEIKEQVLSTFEQMHERLEATREQIDTACFYELQYEDLVADLQGEMEKLYKFLDVGDFATIQPAIEQYAERSRRYRTNRYELDAESRAAVTDRWASYLRKHGYEQQAHQASAVKNSGKGSTAS